MIARAQFDDYHVDLDTTGRSYGLSNPTAFVRFGKFSAPLAEVLKEKPLIHGSKEHRLPLYVIGQIEAWARSVGFPT